LSDNLYNPLAKKRNKLSFACWYTISHIVYEGIVHLNEELQFGIVDVDLPWTFLQEQEVGFPGLEETILILSNTMLKQPDEPQAKLIALSFADVPRNPRNATSLTWTPPPAFYSCQIQKITSINNKFTAEASWYHKL